MKKIYTIALALIAAQLSTAQPVLNNGNTPAVGYSDSVVLATGTNVGPSGAGVVWDFSGMSTTNIGSFSIVAPSSTPHAATFPNSNYAVQLNAAGLGTFYEYYTIDAGGWYINASGYSASSTSNNYTPNSKLRVPFPFSFGNTKTDTFQKVGSSLDAYTITYDGYGTLKVPGATYNNVVRLKYEWIGGEVAYNWFTTSPLFYVATWSQNSGGQFNFLGKNLPTTAVSGLSANSTEVSVFPNPAKGFAIVQVKGGPAKHCVCVLKDAAGRIVKEEPLKDNATIEQGSLPAGLYLYDIRSNGVSLGRGKLVFQ